MTPHGVEVHLPEGYDESKAVETIDKHKQWIERRTRELSELVELSKQLEIVDKSVEELKELVKSLAEQATMEFRVVVREMSKRWASLSSKGVLTINKLARYLPEPLLKYIVYHEICHLIERRHSSRFWSCVEKSLPDYRELEMKLRACEVKLMQQR